MADEEKNQEEKDTKKSKTASKKVEKLISEVESLSVLELAELVEALEDTFGVSAAPVAAPMAGGAVPAAGDGGSEEEKDSYTVVLAQTGGQKIQVIKALRTLDQSLGLKEAKEKSESTPAEILKDVDKEEAEKAKKALEEAGATVELK